MIFTRTAIFDVLILEPKIHGDERGYFVETFRANLLEDFLGYPIHFCQDNESKNSCGVLRSFHYQLPTHAQTKLVRVIEGSVLDVAVYINKNSPYFGKHIAVELKEDFDLEHHLETYGTKEEFLQKVRYFLTHENEKKAIAQNGFEKCLANYTTKASYEEIFGYLEL